jgi:hypothetical protein
MTKLILPLHYAQMSKPVVFWYSKKLQHIMCPPSIVHDPPSGYEKIECRHAHEVDKWSNMLRAQEKRVKEMTDEERYNFEEPIRAQGIAELKKQLMHANPINRGFLEAAIKLLEMKREERKKEVVETAMHCEAKEGVAS